MEVTNKNFNDVLPMVLQAIDECDFMAMDAELSGLDSGHQNSTQNRNVVNPFDTPGLIYMNRVRDSASSFAVLQFGLTTFKWDEQKVSYLIRS